MMQETIKVVASTNVWKDFGESADFPMWKSVGCNEYIIGYTNGIPTFEDIGKMVADLQHVLEGKIESNIIEVFTGYEIYDAKKLTHNEFFQLKYGDGQIDYEAEDITTFEVDEEEDKDS